MKKFQVALITASFALVASGCSDAQGPQTNDDSSANAGGGGFGSGGGDAGGSVGTGGVGGSDTSVTTCSTDAAAALSALGVPGVSIGIVKDGRLACTGVAGMADIEQARPVAPDTVFAWASVSKTITATAAMILVDDGAIGLDDEINDHLPFTVDNPHCPESAITLRQLLTHTSSVIDGPAYDASYTVGDPEVSLGDFLQGYLVPGGAAYSASDNYDYDCAGTYTEYSNVAVGLLGHVVEVVAGVPFDQFCRERIFTRLGMSETSFHLAGVTLDNVAMPYNVEGGELVANGHVGFPTFPDGSLRTSVTHLARFLAMSAELGVYNGERIVTEASAQAMREIQNAELDDAQSLIWYYDHDGLLGHNGSDPGTSSDMFFDPSSGAGVLIVANGDWYGEQDDAAAVDQLLADLFSEAAGL